MRTNGWLAILLLRGSFLAVLVSCHKDGSDEANQNADGDEVPLGLSDKELESILGEESVKYAKRSCQKLGIAEPVQVKDAVGYWDGGSRALMLVDAKGIEYEFKVWHGFFGPMDILQTDKEGRYRVELGGPEEQDLYGVLLRWILEHPKRDALLGREDIDPVKDGILGEASQFYFRMKRRIIPEHAWTNIGPKPIDRSWIDGTMTVSAAMKGHETRILVCGSWRDVKPGLKVRYNIWLVDKKGQDSFRYKRSRALAAFNDEIASFPDYGSVGKPYRFACDYEIWDGEPGKGQLLAKNSVFSRWYGD